MTRQTQGAQQQTVDVPSLGEGQTMIRSSDILPGEVSLAIHEQSDILMDKIVDPTQYIVGPGDLLLVYLWGAVEKAYRIRVTPEGYLILPTVGLVDVTNLTLEETGLVVKEAISQRYTNLDTSVFLWDPRRFRLYVSGIVYVPGMHESNSMERVSDLMIRAGLIQPGTEGEADQSTQALSKSLSGGQGGIPSGQAEEAQKTAVVSVPKRAGVIGRTYANTLGRTRRIEQVSVMDAEDLFTLGEKRGSSSRSIIIHRDGKEITADLLRFIKLGDLDANPYVNSGDHIEVPPYGGDITVYGWVNDQGIYEFKEGDRVCDLVGFGSGLTSVADTSHAELARFDANGRDIVRIEIDLYDALLRNPDASRYLLEESDRLYVRKKYDYKILYDVTIVGEVKYPGQYPIQKGITKLSDLIPMAGDLTGSENLEEARLIRRESMITGDREYERIKNLEYLGRTWEEQDYMRSFERTFAGSINTDFVKLFRDRDTDYDVLLQDGDIVYIPMRRDLVNVMGAVREPGYIKVQEGADYRYYIEKAGGFNFNAYKNRARIVKARSSQKLQLEKKVKIEAGDTIHIPERGERNIWSYFREYSNYLTIAATSYLLIVGMK